jgi:hypothetical protein
LEKWWAKEEGEAQGVADPKSNPKPWATSEFFENLNKVRNCPLCESGHPVWNRIRSKPNGFKCKFQGRKLRQEKICSKKIRTILKSYNSIEYFFSSKKLQYMLYFG